MSTRCRAALIVPGPRVMTCLGTSSTLSKNRALSCRVCSVSAATRVRDPQRRTRLVEPDVPVGADAQQLSPRCPWACINAVRHLLSKFDYDDKGEEIVGEPDPLIVGRALED